MSSDIDKLIIALCVIFGIMTAIIISNKFHKATSFNQNINTKSRIGFKKSRVLW